jgi:hypothetical protein
MTRQTLTVGLLATFCVDDVVRNADGSFSAVNPTAGACAAIPPQPHPPIMSTVHYPTQSGQGFPTRPAVDISKFENLFGHTTYPDPAQPATASHPAYAKDQALPMPGRAGASVVVNIAGDRPFSSEFIVPGDKAYQGAVGASTYHGVHALKIGWSRTRDVFESDARYTTGYVGSGESGPKWSNAHSNMALMHPGEKWYLVVELVDKVPGLAPVGLVNDFGTA